MTTPLSKLRTYNRPTNGLAWVLEAERMLAEAYERPVDAAGREDAPVIPPGATEFESDGMRALRFTDTMGDACEMRVPSADKWETRWPDEDGAVQRWGLMSYSPLVARAVPSRTAPAHAWLRSVWAEMREKPLPRADEPIERAAEIDTCPKCGSNKPHLHPAVQVGGEVSPCDNDPCLGELPGVMNACCGHGIESECYVQLVGGKCLRGNDAMALVKLLEKAK